MTTPIVVPALGESVSEATIAKWMKKVGDPIRKDEALVELETDKVTVEVFASIAGSLGEITAPAGSTVKVGTIVGLIADGNGAAVQAAPLSKPQTSPVPAARPAAVTLVPTPAPKAESAEDRLSPAVRKLIEENALNPAQISASGKDGRLTKADVLDHLEKHKSAAPQIPAQASVPAPQPSIAQPRPAEAPATPRALGAREERVPMSRLRRRVAERLKQAQNNAAMLTTFNEADMSAVMALRDRYKETFEKRHQVKLGFMSFFVKAAIQALMEIPAVNAEIDAGDIIYKNHYDIGVAVGTGQGLVVPVLRDADHMNFAETEAKITELGKRARDGKLTIEELTGGTFTISNGGVYGSLMSTPILNPPQSGILGMHKIQPRPIAVGDKIEIRPMMYLALSYDHRIIDGREAVTFLVRIKESLEDPQRLLLEL